VADWCSRDSKGHGDSKTPDQRLTDSQLQQLKDVYMELKLPAVDAKMSNSVAVLKTAVVGDQTYQTGDDLLVKFAEPDGKQYTWPVKIHSIFSHCPSPDKEAVWFRFRRYQEVVVRGRAYRGTIDRQICALPADPDDIFYSPSVIESPVAVFHYCRLDLEIGADSKEAKEVKRGRQAVRFDSNKAVERDGPACRVMEVEECRLHSARDCAHIDCATDESRRQVKRFVHDHRRALYAIDRNWTGH